MVVVHRAPLLPAQPHEALVARRGPLEGAPDADLGRPAPGGAEHEEREVDPRGAILVVLLSVEGLEAARRHHPRQVQERQRRAGVDDPVVQDEPQGLAVELEIAEEDPLGDDRLHQVEDRLEEEDGDDGDEPGVEPADPGGLAEGAQVARRVDRDRRAEPGALTFEAVSVEEHAA